jgi:hypothetical protein
VATDDRFLHNTSSIVTCTVARLRAVSLTLGLDRSLLFVAAIIIILIHFHLTSCGLQMGLLRLRLWWSLRLDRRWGLCRRLSLRLRRLLLSWGCRRRLIPTLLSCEDARRWLGINLRRAESWGVVSSLRRMVVFSSTSLVLCASHL